MVTGQISVLFTERGSTNKDWCWAWNNLSPDPGKYYPHQKNPEFVFQTVFLGIIQDLLMSQSEGFCINLRCYMQYNHSIYISVTSTTEQVFILNKIQCSQQGKSSKCRYKTAVLCTESQLLAIISCAWSGSLGCFRGRASLHVCFITSSSGADLWLSHRPLFWAVYICWR